MKQRVQAIMDLVPATNITEACHMIVLISYYRKFFPVFNAMMLLLNELTKNNIPFKWMKLCQKSLDYVKQVITSSPTLVYHDLDKNITCLLIVANIHGVESFEGIRDK